MDDAASTIYSAFLVEEEGMTSSFQACLETFTAKGLPSSLYSDKQPDCPISGDWPIAAISRSGSGGPDATKGTGSHGATVNPACNAIRTRLAKPIFA